MGAFGTDKYSYTTSLSRDEMYLVLSSTLIKEGKRFRGVVNNDGFKLTYTRFSKVSIAGACKDGEIEFTISVNWWLKVLCIILILILGFYVFIAIGVAVVNSEPILLPTQMLLLNIVIIGLNVFYQVLDKRKALKELTVLLKAEVVSKAI